MKKKYSVERGVPKAANKSKKKRTKKGKSVSVTRSLKDTF